MIREKNDLSLPLHSILPKSWKEEIGTPLDNLAFRNLDHFKYVVSKLKQVKDDNTGTSYAKALEDLLANRGALTAEKRESIRNLVRSNLHKRGLITEEVYENFRYTVDGTNVGVDVGKYASGKPDCVMSPAVQYVDFFYELYISISYPWDVTDESVKTNTAKLLAAIEELERQHIFIKIVTIFPARNVTRRGGQKLFSTIPLFSHKERKSVETMSAVVNERLLRKFYFAIMEDLYGDDLSSNYGNVIRLEDCMCIGDDFNEVEFFENIVKAVGA